MDSHKREKNNQQPSTHVWTHTHLPVQPKVYIDNDFCCCCCCGYFSSLTLHLTQLHRKPVIWFNGHHHEIQIQNCRNQRTHIHERACKSKMMCARICVRICACEHAQKPIFVHGKVRFIYDLQLRTMTFYSCIFNNKIALTHTCMTD